MAGRAEPGSAPEADATVAVRGPELDVGDLRGGDPDVLAPLVGDPQHVAGAGERRLDARLEVVAVRVVGEFDVDLKGGLGHSDAYVHAATLPASPHRLGLAGLDCVEGRVATVAA